MTKKPAKEEPPKQLIKTTFVKERILTENKESQIFQRVIVYCKDVPAAEHIDGHYDSHNDHTDTNR